METQRTQRGAKNAKAAERLAPAVCSSKVQNDAADFETCGAEVHQQAEMQPGRTQVIQALQAMRAAEQLHGFKFDQDRVLHQQIGEVIAHRESVIENGNSMLLLGNQAGFAQFVRQRIFINFLQESAAKGARDVRPQPMICRDSRFSSVPFAVICVPLRYLR